MPQWLHKAPPHGPVSGAESAAGGRVVHCNISKNSLQEETLDMAINNSRLFSLAKPVASRHLTSLSLLKNPTPASEDCRLTLDLDQN